MIGIVSTQSIVASFAGFGVVVAALSWIIGRWSLRRSLDTDAIISETNRYLHTELSHVIAERDEMLVELQAIRARVKQYRYFVDNL